MTLETVLAEFFTSAPCSVCTANDLPTAGPTYHDSETNGHLCLGCLELSTETLPDPEVTEIFAEYLAQRGKGNTDHARN